MLCKILLLLSLSQTISSSLVVDSKSQISVTDYCPKMKFCPEGAHVMCMYYNPNSIMGPRCTNAMNITMTPELANKLIEVTNASAGDLKFGRVRSQIALGEVKGKNAELLPKGYGVFRLSWDSELATFAQVLANQCVMRNDLCRSTKNFPDPGQSAGLFRFTYPDWLTIQKTISKSKSKKLKSDNFTTPGLSPAKVMSAVTQVLKSWFEQKGFVTPSMITLYPDWAENPNEQYGKTYLEMIYGSTTHMGCGISAYTEYDFHDDKAKLSYNSIQIMCNYSARPRKGTAVYNTVSPPAVPFSRCGCPVGTVPDDECLCNLIDKEKLPQQPSTLLKHETGVCTDSEVCDPPVVVLPIFTVEDAPPEKLFTRNRYANESLRQRMDDVIFQRRDNNMINSKRNFYELDKTVNKPNLRYSKHNALQKQSLERRYNRLSPQQQKVTIRNRYFDKKHMESKLTATRQTTRRMLPIKKTSLFSRAAKFQLPDIPIQRPINEGRKTIANIDVEPRHDFFNAKQLVKNYYLNGQNNLPTPQHKNELKNNGNKTFIEHKLPKIDYFNEHETSIDDLNGNNNHKKPMYRSNIHEKYTIFNKHEQPDTREADTKNRHNMVEQHDTLRKRIDNKNNFQELLHILNASKPNSGEIVKYKDTPTTETELSTAVQKNETQNAVLQQIVRNPNGFGNRLNSVTEETDSKLMALLDNLEQEVKHVELLDKNKQLFDVKIRKIYGEVVGNTVNLTNLNTLRNRSKIRENNNDFGDRKTYTYNNLNRNKYTHVYKDEPGQRGTDNMYRGIKNEVSPYYRDDEAKHRNLNHELEHTVNKLEFHRNDDNEQRIRNKNYYLSNDAGKNDALSVERRRFYQDKLDNIERMIQMRKYKRRKDNPPQMRPMRPATRKSENEMNLYGRARYDRGY